MNRTQIVYLFFMFYISLTMYTLYSKSSGFILELLTISIK